MTTGQISRDEMHGALEDKLCSYFGVTGKEATDEQVFQASAMVIREIMSRLLAAEKAETPDKQVHYLSMEFLMGRSLMKNAYNLGVANTLAGAIEDATPLTSSSSSRTPAWATAVSAASPPAIWTAWPPKA